MDWALVAVQWLHVISAIVWLGGFLYLSFVVIPTLTKTVPPDAQRRFGTAIGEHNARVFSVAGGLVLVLGIVRGLMTGRIPDQLGQSYGIYWSTALVLTIFLVGWGAVAIGAKANRLYRDDGAWAPAPGGGPSAALREQAAGLRRNTFISLAVFVVVFTLMILMRFS